MRRPRVLVVSHDASRSGAPRVALAIVAALAHEDWDCRVVLRWPGPLRAEFAATGSNVSMEPGRRVRALLRRWRRTRRWANRLEQVAAAFVIRVVRPDVVWCNTVLSACYVRPAVRRGKAVVLHAHEPAERIGQVLGRYHLDDVWSSVQLVGCAPRVCADLAHVASRPLDQVACLPSVPDGKVVLELAGRGQPTLPVHGVLVGACGAVNRTKGVDLWLELVAQVAPAVADLDPHFVWVGGPPPADLAVWSASTGLGHRVTFTGSVDNPYPWLAALDVFTLTSRQDQFPLVVLEAMTLGRAVVAFAVGDVPTQLGGAGRLVPPLSTVAAAEAVVALLRDPDGRSRLGQAARTRAWEHFPMSGFASSVEALAAESFNRGCPPDHRAQASSRGTS